MFAAVVYVLVSGCAWRSLPPYFGVSTSTAHRWFVIWTQAGVWDRLHHAVFAALAEHDSQGLKPVITALFARRGTGSGWPRIPGKLHTDKTYDQPEPRRWVRGKRIGVRRP